MPVEPSAALFSVTELPLGLVVVLEVLPSLAVVVSTFPVLPELSRSEDEPPPEEDPPEDWA